MKLSIFHQDPDVLARMAQRIAEEFHPCLMLLELDVKMPSALQKEKQGTANNPQGSPKDQSTTVSPDREATR